MLKRLFLKIKKTASPITTFIFMMLLSHVVILIVSLFSDGRTILDLFFIKGNDTFMDFFNSVRDASQGAKAYSIRHIIYPPMAAATFLLFSNFFPNAYLQTPFAIRETWPQYEGAYYAIAIFLILTVLALFFACYYPRNFSHPIAVLIAVFGVCNVPNLYAIERGNIILFSTAAVIFFAFTYDSKNKLVREASLLALAFAFSIKLYPVLFASLLLVDKRYKDLIKCAIYSILLLLLPSLFFGGIWHCVKFLFENTFSFSATKTSVTATDPSWVLWMQVNNLKKPYYIFLALSVVCFIFTCFIRRKKEGSASSLQNWIYICALILALPPLQNLYAAGLLFAPLLMILRENKWSLRNGVYFILIVSVLIPIPHRFSPSYSYTEAIFPTVCFLLLLACLVDAIIFIKNYIFSKKKENTTAAKHQSN